MLDLKPLLDWTGGPAFAWVLGAALLYWLGGRRGRRPRASAADRWRTAAFIAGLATIVVALDSPIDDLAEELLWVHMIQHILLLVVAPPQLALARVRRSCRLFTRRRSAKVTMAALRKGRGMGRPVRRQLRASRAFRCGYSVGPPNASRQPPTADSREVGSARSLDSSSLLRDGKGRRRETVKKAALALAALGTWFPISPIGLAQCLSA